ncbi:hypothetical protein BCV71DRAFT_261042 [Rhizopus microsporus]|uniref:Tc1-like transposase DDE domain-containing protein n=1 Tax=Rhizopus microsporus TaxID=58291 RepID=A0A1X0SB99_RHIZD|nr:hypothetical protein BCV71DRAFT_261042 [Rhizopus microsporus]
MQYIAMDNAPFHKPKDDINELIKRSIRLPPYCPELKSIEHLWAIFKSKVKRSQFGDAEDLNTRISEGSQDIPTLESNKNFINYKPMIQSYIDKENDSGCAMEAEEDSAFQYSWIHPPQDGNLADNIGANVDHAKYRTLCCTAYGEAILYTYNGC